MVGQRAQARATAIRAITDEGRRQLARDGAANLSLRSVAREVGMVSSAVYRYVESRDELLTLLIIEAYNDLADAIEAVPLKDARRSWRDRCRAIRRWAREHTNEYALLYGSPVPGYAAPEDTIVPATRVYAAMLAPVALVRARATTAALPRSVRQDAERVAETLRLDAPAPQVVRALGAVTSVFGLISFELFGHTQNVISDNAVYFDFRVDAIADELKL
jgi:AcrR family transcriptional regulator